MIRSILKGAVDQSVIVRIVDSGDGTPETGVTSATGGLDLKYRREGASTADLTESDLGAVNSAHSDGGMIHVGAGYYRIDLPDAAVASGADGVLVFGTVTGMIVIGCYAPLVAFNPQDGVRLGLTALPNAGADAAGGLPISDAGGLDLDAQVGTDIDAILVDTGTTLDGRIPAALTADGNIKADTLRVGGTLQTARDLGASVLVGDKTGFSLSSAGVQAIWDAATSALTTVGSIGKRLVDYLTGDAFARLGAPAGASVSADVAAVKVDTAAILVDTGTTLDGRIPAALVGGRIDASVGAVAAGAIDAAAIATDAIDADALKADAVTEIQAGLALDATVAKAATAALEASVQAVKAKTDALPSDPADASDIATSFAAVTSTLSALAGYIDTEVASILAAVDTEVAAIKAKTDNLPASPAAVGSTMTLTSGERDAVAAALLDLAAGVEAGLTVRQALRLSLAALAGKLSGAGTATEVFRNAVADSKARITATVDASGNRSAITTDLS